MSDEDEQQERMSAHSSPQKVPGIARTSEVNHIDLRGISCIQYVMIQGIVGVVNDSEDEEQGDFDDNYEYIEINEDEDDDDEDADEEGESEEETSDEERVIARLAKASIGAGIESEEQLVGEEPEEPKTPEAKRTSTRSL